MGWGGVGVSDYYCMLDISKVGTFTLHDGHYIEWLLRVGRKEGILV